MKKNITILIVDDAEMNRDILKEIIDQSYTVIEAVDGQHAVDILDEQFSSVDLMLLDINMPKLNGFDLLKVMNDREWIKTIPVIMISSDMTTDYMDRAYALGAVDYIARPFDYSVVQHRVENTLMLFQKQKQTDYELHLANQRHLDAIMHTRREAVCSYRMNMTQNCFEYGSGKFIDYFVDDQKMTVDEVFESIAQRMTRPEKKEEFLKKFSAKALLKGFWDGKSEETVTHRCVIPNKRICLFETSISMFQNPISNDVEAILYQEDITEDYVKKRLPELLYNHEYLLVGLVNLQYKDLTINKCTIDELDLEIDANYGYEEFRQRCVENCVKEDDENAYLKKSDMSFIKEQVEKNGSYEFAVKHTVGDESRLLNYRYLYFSKDLDIFLLAVEDITDMSERDLITGGVNRSGFIRKARKILKESREDQNFAVLFIDLLGFKGVNEIFGMNGGDNLLTRILKSLEESLLKPEVVSRVESDHYTMLVPIQHLDYDCLGKMLQWSFTESGKTFHIYAKCGIYLIDDKSIGISSMCDRAKMAEEFVENNYVKPYEVYNSKMRDGYVDKSEILSELDEALMNKDLKVYYQPVFDARTRKIASAEALVRWISPKRGMLSPGVFIPALEENGRIAQVDHYMETNLRLFMEIRYLKGQKIVPVSQNLSRMDFYDKNFMDHILDNVTRTILPKDSVRYEVTESAYTTISLSSDSTLKKLKKQGVKIYLDDFGSGYSSFSTIQEFDFDVIKLDMGFVRQIGKNRKTERIIAAIIDMSHGVDAKVIAEGVETEEQMQFLIDCDCDYIQGYYLSRPLPEEEFAKLLDAEDEK